jgi:hypothetical protein
VISITRDSSFCNAYTPHMLREQCPKCGFHFPYLTEQPSSFAVFKDAAPSPPLDNEDSTRISEPAGQA